MQHWEQEKWKYQPANTNLAIKKKKKKLDTFNNV